MTSTMLWRRLDREGMEAAVMGRGNPNNWQLHGTVLLEEAGQPCRLDYAVVCDHAWRTLWARVSGWIGTTPINHRVARSLAGEWRHNGVIQPQVAGCVDIDLAFTPITNTVPIRRLALEPGASAPVRAAWLRFPDFSLEALDQVYTRQNDHRYRYQSGGGRFTAELEVDEEGLVLRYGDLWVAETVYRTSG